jgi:hypothetical protein
VRGSGREEAHVCAECQLRGVMRPSGGRLGPPAEAEHRRLMPFDFAGLGTY